MQSDTDDDAGLYRTPSHVVTGESVQVKTPCRASCVISTIVTLYTSRNRCRDRSRIKVWCLRHASSGGGFCRSHHY